MRLADLWPFRRPRADPALFGCWRRIRSDGPSDPFNVVELDLRPGGVMVHSLHDGLKWRVAELAFRTEGGILIISDAAGTVANRMGYALENEDLLRLDSDEGCTWYGRSAKQAPRTRPSAECSTPIREG
jgi:hypothetical protein